MEHLFSSWTDFLGLLEENGKNLINNPIIWILIVLAVVGIYGLYDIPSKTKRNSLGNVVRQTIQVILDTSGDVLNMLRSLTGFIGVLRMLIFGKLNNRTLRILINYAIIFLSMASFSTTFSGLTQISNWALAALISFGIQVSILIFSTKIQQMLRGKENRKIATKKKYYLANKTVERAVCIQRAHILAGEKEKETEEVERGRERENRGKKRTFLVVALPPLLAGSVFLSSFFSYSFMFKKFVKPQLPFDDHFRSISVVHEISNEYSEEIRTYLSEIRSVLSQYNYNVEEWLEIRDDNPMIQQQQLKDLEDQIEDKEKEAETEQRNLDAADPDSSEYRIIRERINRLKDEAEDLREQYEERRETLQNDTTYSNQLAVYESILLLTDFYGNPLYLMEGKEDEVRSSFAALQMAEAASRETDKTGNHAFDDEKAAQIQDILENYISLSKYFSEQKKVGVDFSKIIDRLQKIDYNKELEKEDYQQQTSQVLGEMLKIMNEIPILENVENVWTNEVIKAPRQTEHLDKIYDLYRDNSETTQDFERALKNLLASNSEKRQLSAQLALIALAIDLTIVWLMFLRGRKPYDSNAADLRRLMGILLIDDTVDRESEKYRREQGFCMTVGIVSGVLFYSLYKISGSGQGASKQADVFSFLFFMLMGLAVALVLYKIYRKVVEHEQQWQDETLYLRWKEIWTAGIGDDKELKKRIEDLKSGRMPEGIDLNEDDIQRIMKSCSKENKRPLFMSHFYENVIGLMQKLEMKECQKVTLFYEVGKNIEVDYFSEKITLPCLEEEAVKEFDMETEFSVLNIREMAAFDYDEESENGFPKGYYILNEYFWNLLYDAVLVRVVGGRLNEWDIEEELQDGIGSDEDKEDWN